MARKKKKRTRAKPASKKTASDADVIVMNMSEANAPTLPEVKLLQK